MASTVSAKVVLITGGAGGIGLAMIKQLLLNGAKGVAMVDISQESGDRAVKEISSTFGPDKIIFVKTDITVKEELEAAFERTVQKFQQLDIVINNAGIVDEEDWRKSIDVNFIAVVEGTYLASQKYFPKYKSGKEGIIVNTASLAGIGPLQNAPVYAASKHAVVGLGKSLGGEKFYNLYQVRILTICPGFVRSALVQPEHGSRLMFGYKEEVLSNIILQDPAHIGKSLIEIIEKGKNGSLWAVVDEMPPYEVPTPKPKYTFS